MSTPRAQAAALQAELQARLSGWAERLDCLVLREGLEPRLAAGAAAAEAKALATAIRWGDRSAGGYAWVSCARALWRRVWAWGGWERLRAWGRRLRGGRSSSAAPARPPGGPATAPTSFLLSFNVSVSPPPSPSCSLLLDDVPRGGAARRRLWRRLPRRGDLQWRPGCALCCVALRCAELCCAVYNEGQRTALPRVPRPAAACSAALGPEPAPLTCRCCAPPACRHVLPCSGPAAGCHRCPVRQRVQHPHRAAPAVSTPLRAGCAALAAACRRRLRPRPAAAAGALLACRPAGHRRASMPACLPPNPARQGVPAAGGGGPELGAGRPGRRPGAAGLGRGPPGAPVRAGAAAGGGAAGGGGGGAGGAAGREPAHHLEGGGEASGACALLGAAPPCCARLLWSGHALLVHPPAWRPCHLPRAAHGRCRPPPPHRASRIGSPHLASAHRQVGERLMEAHATCALWMWLSPQLHVLLPCHPIIPSAGQGAHDGGVRHLRRAGRHRHVCAHEGRHAGSRGPPARRTRRHVCRRRRCVSWRRCDRGAPLHLPCCRRCCCSAARRHHDGALRQCRSCPRRCRLPPMPRLLRAGCPS